MEAFHLVYRLVLRLIPGWRGLRSEGACSRKLCNRREEGSGRFAVAKAIRFEIALDGKVTCTAMNADGIIIVTNEAREYPVKIRKADIAGDEIPGAKLTITDAEGKEVKSWTSEADKVHSVALLDRKSVV